ncbi:hypothetical protein [Sporosarcina sp. FSL K6-3457]|uniref:hypothetical protein n=1 Tax=Sporosarcina sp. FSL K6-3457 TaxID=2978204 RepID=UPI0030F9C39F
MNQTVKKYKKNIPYIYLIIFTAVSEIYLFTTATPYEAINQLRFYCYIVMIFAILAWFMLRTYKPFWVNAAITGLIFCLVVIQNYMLPQLTYVEAQRLVSEKYQIVPEKTNLTVLWSEKGTDLYLIIGYVDGEKRFYSVNPITEKIGELGNLESSIFSK